MSAPVTGLTRFDRDTALQPLGDGRFAGRMDPGWWIERGPNGGYVAAIVLRGLTMAVDDIARTPRSLTIHYLAPPAEGDVVMETTIERTGRRVTFVTGRLLQGDRLLALAMAAFAVSIPGVEFADITMPSAVPIDQTEPIPLMQRPERATRADARALPAAVGDRRSALHRRRPRKRSSAAGSASLTPRPVDHLSVAAMPTRGSRRSSRGFPADRDPDGRSDRALPRASPARLDEARRLLPRRVPHAGRRRRLHRGGRRGVESRRRPARPLPPARRPHPHLTAPTVRGAKAG